MIANIKTVAVYVSDQTAALRFYTEKLGFEVRRTESMGPDGTWVEVAPRGALSRVVIYPRTLMHEWEHRRPSIMFGCEDIEATYRELSRRGVKFTQVPKRMPWGTFAQFVDLDGNEFVLTEGT